MKKIISMLLIILMSTSLVGCSSKDNSIGSNNTADDVDTTVDLDNSDEKIAWDELEEETINLSNKTISITNGGVYNLIGTISNGSINVDTNADVKLVLNNVTITSNDGPTINIISSNNTIIELATDSKNILTDSSTRSDTNLDGCIYSADDLVIQGMGSLTINANYADGIVSKDDLKIVSGTYIINSKDDGIRGKDSVYILDGNFTINSDADGIKSTNDTDSDKGYVYIEGGTFKINAKEDGIQAETKLIINDGTFDITAGAGASSTSSAIGNYYYGNTYEDTSTKGLKAGNNLVLAKASIIINSSDDAIHSNNYIAISSGTLTLSSGDDGIHADEEIIIDGGNITINKSYEGIEAANITINGGAIEVTSSDDGINICGGYDQSAQGRYGSNSYNQSTGVLTINAGTVKVHASGDGLDANGSIVINGGTIYVDGPTNNGNGALDYDQNLNINGGVILAIGSSGMAQSASDTSKQNSFLLNLNSSYSAGSVIKISDGSTDLISYTAVKSFQSMLFSSSKLATSKSYKVIIDGVTVQTITLSSNVTIVGNTNQIRPGH